MDLHPIAPVLAPGARQQLEATGIYSDGSERKLTREVSWTSSNETVATVDEEGEARALSPGQAIVTATLKGVEGRAVLTVTPAELTALRVEGPDAPVPAGIRVELSATGTFSDGSELNLTSLVEWSSSDESVAAFTSPGSLGTHQAGTVELQASHDGLTTTLSFEVSAAQVVSFEAQPAAAVPSTVHVGGTLQLQAIATLSNGDTIDLTSSVTWTSEHQDVATVDATTAEVTGAAAGQATILATLEDAERTLQSELIVAVLEAPLPSLVIPAGEHSFDTSTGMLALEGQEPALAPGWKANSHRLALSRFTLEADATLRLTGNAPFRVLALEDITLAGAVDGRGADGADGSAGSSNVPGEPGEPGRKGHDISIIGLANVEFSGVIDVGGGNGGRGGPITAASPGIHSHTSGDGGHGGAAGIVTLEAAGTLLETGSVHASGGHGGDGGDIFFGDRLLTFSPTRSGRGGDGGVGLTGGDGGRGGDITIDERIHTPNLVVSGNGGAGGAGLAFGGNGGRAGNIHVEGNVNFHPHAGGVDLSTGNGGPGGFGPGRGGDGGDGGSVTVVGKAFSSPSAGHGGDGGGSDDRGGDGGDGGSVSTGGEEPGSGGKGGRGGQPGGVDGRDGTP